MTSQKFCTVGLMQDVLIYLLDAAPEAVQALCSEVCISVKRDLVIDLLRAKARRPCRHLCSEVGPQICLRQQGSFAHL